MTAPHDDDDEHDGPDEPDDDDETPEPALAPVAGHVNGQANGHANGRSRAVDVPVAVASGGAAEARELDAGGHEAPRSIAELADACVRYVERALGVRLDFEPETLPLLDHYLDQARGEKTSAEARALLARTAGAYFGEVIRRRHASWWSADDADPEGWQVQFEAAPLLVHPVVLVLAALGRPDEPPPSVVKAGDEPADEEEEEDEEGDEEHEAVRRDADFLAAAEATELEITLVVGEGEREAVERRLAELPAVSEREYYGLATRLEVIDIALDAMRARRIAGGLAAEASLTPRDYEGGVPPGRAVPRPADGGEGDDD